MAAAFVKRHQIDPRQILSDMDRAFIQDNHMTKGNSLMEFWELQKDNDSWAIFFAKQDLIHMDAYTMYDHYFTDDEKAAVLQKNLPKELQPMYAMLVQQGKSYPEIKKEFIAYEIMEKKNRKSLALATREFVRSRYDRNHMPRDSSQSSRWRYRDQDARRSTSPGGDFRSRSQSPGRRDRSHSPSGRDRYSGVNLAKWFEH